MVQLTAFPASFVNAGDRRFCFDARNVAYCSLHFIGMSCCGYEEDSLMRTGVSLSIRKSRSKKMKDINSHRTEHTIHFCSGGLFSWFLRTW